MQPASYCEKYPIMNYTLVVNSSLNDEVVRSMSAVHADNFMLNEILSENADYSFKISVANTVGIVSTVNRHFCKSYLFQELEMKALFFPGRHY